jgi:putative ABC transport system permease protein
MLTMLISGLTTGFIFAPLAMGVYISYRILRFTDISVDGTFTLGGFFAARLLMWNMDPVSATLLGIAAGAAAGACTGLFITRFGIQRILAGILVMTALYSVNQFVLGANIYNFDKETTLYSYAEAGAAALFGSTDAWELIGMKFLPTYLMSMLIYVVVSLLFCGVLLLFWRTRLGLALRGAGSNEKAVRALGVNVPLLLVITLAISNGMAALSGALWAQHSLVANQSDGMGMIVTGLACVMIGDAFFGRRRFAMRFVGATIGALIYGVLMALLVHVPATSGDVKLFTAVFVIIALVTPRMLRSLRPSRTIAPQSE